MIEDCSGVKFETGFDWFRPRHIFDIRLAIFWFGTNPILWLFANPPVPSVKLPDGDPIMLVQIFEFAKQGVVARVKAKTAAMLI